MEEGKRESTETGPQKALETMKELEGKGTLYASFSTNKDGLTILGSSMVVAIQRVVSRGGLIDVSTKMKGGAEGLISINLATHRLNKLENVGGSTIYHWKSDEVPKAGWSETQFYFQVWPLTSE